MTAQTETPPRTGVVEKVKTEPLTRKVSGGVTIAVGVIFIVVTLVNNLFAVGPAFEELTDGFRPLLTDEALAQANADIEMLAAVSEEFTTAVIPALAGAFGTTPEEFGALMGQQFPAVAEGVQQLPAITTTFAGLVGLLEAQQEVFASADAIPTTNLPATTIPWGLTIAGLLAIAAGVYMLLSPGRASAIVTLILGLALVIGPLVMSLPSKAADADEMNDNLFPVYTQETVDGARAALTTVGAMGAEMQTAMLPAVAQQLNMSQEELNAFLGASFPATATALQELPQAMERFEGFVGAFEANLENYETMHPVRFAPIIWMVIIGGAVLILTGGYCLVTKK